MRTVILSDVPTTQGIPAPRLLIEQAAWEKLHLYITRSGQYEINGFGYISRVNDDFVVSSADDIFITPQVVSFGSAIVDGKAFARAAYQATIADRLNDLRLQWHSHVNFEAYFSGTDTGTIESYGAAGMEWFISLVANVRGDVSARVDVYRPLRLSLPLSVVVFPKHDKSLVNRIDEEIANLVSIEGGSRRLFGKRPERIIETTVSATD